MTTHNERYVLEAGQALAKAGSERLAAEYYVAVTKVHPKLVAAYSCALELYLALDDLACAEEVLQEVIRVFGEHPKTLTRLAKVYAKMERPLDAIYTVRKALAIDPELPEALELEQQLCNS